MVSPTGALRTLLRIASWATPHVKEWRRNREFHSVEAFRHLQARNWREAEQHCQAALSEGHYSRGHRVELMVGLSESQRKQGRLEDAEQTARAGISISAAVKDVGTRANALESLLNVLIDQGRHAEASMLATEIERVERSQGTPDVARIVGCMRKVAAALAQTNQKEEAAAALAKANRLCQQVLGRGHIETANTWVELGTVYRESGDQGPAQRCLRSALDVYTTLLGVDAHPTTRCLSQLGLSLHESGQIDEAVLEFQRVLTFMDRQVGGDAAHKAEVQARLAALFVKARRTGAARELLIPAIATLEKSPDHRFASALDTMAEIEEAMGRSAEARSCRERARSVANCA